MALPKDKDYKNWEKKKVQYSKGLKPDGSPVREFDDNKAKKLFRDSVRNKWMYCNTKLSYLEKMKIPDLRPETRTIWVWECAKCKELFKKDDVQVDHYHGETPFTEWHQAHDYGEAILNVPHSELQILCTTCHPIKTRAEQLGIDWTTEEGWELTLKEKQITKISELKATPQKQWLQDRGLVPAKNATLRKQQIRDYIMK